METLRVVRGLEVAIHIFLIAKKLKQFFQFGRRVLVPVGASLVIIYFLYVHFWMKALKMEGFKFMRYFSINMKETSQLQFTRAELFTQNCSEYAVLTYAP